VYKVGKKSPKTIHKLKSTQTPNSQRPENIPTHPNRKANIKKNTKTTRVNKDWSRRFDGFAQPNKGMGGAHQSTPRIRSDDSSFPSPISTQRPKGSYKEKAVDTQKKRRKKGKVKLELPNEKRNDIRCSCPDLNYDKEKRKQGKK
jgi:hypothetical protein